ncbi:hypothetical protein GXW82_44500 [Streptacidiphilus sp. 4-A2]|nr:hypothetical protein [Streptacidiphilus sp. 4-A2]
MSDTRYTTEQRRFDRIADAEQLRKDRANVAEQRRKDRADAAEQRRKDADAAQVRQQREKAAARREATRAKEERAERWSKRAGSARAWLMAEADTAFALLVMACAIVPAVTYQWRSLHGHGVGSAIAAALAAMLEASAWVATVGASRAGRDGRPVLPYRIAMWVSASIAATINYIGGVSSHGVAVGLVLAVASLAGIGIWELRSLGRHGTSTRTRAQRAEDRARARHARKRRRAHKDVLRVAERIWSAAPYGSMTPDEAWAVAWEIHTGSADPGLTPELERQRVEARAALRAALTVQEPSVPQPETITAPPGHETVVLRLHSSGLLLPEGLADTILTESDDTASPQVANQMPLPETALAKTARKPRRMASVVGGRVGPGNPPRRRKGDTPKYHPAAAEAARITALETAAGSR